MVRRIDGLNYGLRQIYMTTYFFETAHQLCPSLQQLPLEFHFVCCKKRKTQCVTAHKLAATNITLTVYDDYF